MTFYKTEDDQGKLEQAIASLDDKFNEKEPLTPNMREMVFRPFALECSLEAPAAFQLLKAFFEQEWRIFYYFEQLN